MDEDKGRVKAQPTAKPALAPAPSAQPAPAAAAPEAGAGGGWLDAVEAEGEKGIVEMLGGLPEGVSAKMALWLFLGTVLFFLCMCGCGCCLLYKLVTGLLGGGMGGGGIGGGPASWADSDDDDQSAAGGRTDGGSDGAWRGWDEPGELGEQGDSSADKVGEGASSDWDAEWGASGAVPSSDWCAASTALTNAVALEVHSDLLGLRTSPPARPTVGASLSSLSASLSSCLPSALPAKPPNPVVSIGPLPPIAAKAAKAVQPSAPLLPPGSGSSSSSPAGLGRLSPHGQGAIAAVVAKAATATAPVAGWAAWGDATSPAATAPPAFKLGAVHNADEGAGEDDDDGWSFGPPGDGKV
ncbi:hypothetical protein T492DRAFT_921197 [Pavlovales sp. CCMP2436]|nr:hypothetical protein T492DRAFT_921197 [Pavlovales sp. CCMP2436]